MEKPSIDYTKMQPLSVEFKRDNNKNAVITITIDELDFDANEHLTNLIGRNLILKKGELDFFTFDSHKKENVCPECRRYMSLWSQPADQKVCDKCKAFYESLMPKNMVEVNAEAIKD